MGSVVEKSKEEKLCSFCIKLLSELQFQVKDRSNSSLPELETEAIKLGVVKLPITTQDYPRSMMRGDFN